MANVPNLRLVGPFVNRAGGSVYLYNSGGRARQFKFIGPMTDVVEGGGGVPVDRPLLGQLWPRGYGGSLMSGAWLRPGAAVYRAAAFTLTDSTPTAMPFDTVDVDDGFWSSGAPTRLTVPAVEAGWYSILAQATWPSTAGLTATFVEIYINGVLRAGTVAEITSSGGWNLPRQCGLRAKLDVADYVEMYLTHYQSGASSFDITGGRAATFLQMVRI